VYRAFTFPKTIPVTSAKNEQMFSKMNIVKNRLRTTMGVERLDHSLLMAKLNVKQQISKILQKQHNLINSMQKTGMDFF